MDAFEVEFQQVGGGRLSWSAWSAMVGCAPTREPVQREQFSCARRLGGEHCRTRMRFRVMPHNSRSGNMIAGRPSPHQEVVIGCNLGVPISLETSMYSSGRENRPWTVREHQDQVLVARNRDKILQAQERRRKWLVANRRKTTTISTTTLTTTTIATTRITTRTATPLTTLAPTQDSDMQYTDPTLEDSLSYEQYEDYYDDIYQEDISDDEEEIVEEKEADTPLSCSYSDWSPWSQCSSVCGSGTKSRKRALIPGSVQYCSYTDQTKSCFGTACVLTNDRSAKARATLLLGKFSQHDVERGYEVRSNLKNFTEEDNRELYCVKYEIMHAARLCKNEPELGSLRIGETVCGLCTSKAVQGNEVQCRGSGVLGRVTSWRMFLEPHCSGTWRMLQQMEECDCQERSSFVFV